MEEERDKGKRKERRKERENEERKKERRKQTNKEKKKQTNKGCTFCEVLGPSFFLQFATFRGRLSAL
jgi:hypothetical protein